MVNAEPQSRFHLMDIKQILTGDDAEGGLRNYLIWGTAGVFFLQVFATGLGFVTNVLLARLLGATEYGVYTYVFAWVGLLTVLSMFGFGRLLVREIASYITNTRWGLIHGIIRYVATRSFLISIGVAIIAGLLTWLFKENLNPRMFPAFWIAMIALPFLTLTLLNEQALQGFKKVVLGRIPQVFVRTPLFICSLLLVYWLYPQDLDAVIAIGLQASAISVGFLVGVWLLYLITRKQVLTEKPEYSKRYWLKSALPLLLVAGLFEVNQRATVIILGTLSGPRDAGIFSIASLIAALISFILLAANTALGPVISSLYTSNEISRLQNILTRSARITFLIALVMALALTLLRQWVLLLFGQEFLQIGTLLGILIIGYLFSVAAGSVGMILIMTGREKYTLTPIAVSAVVTILLNVIWIPRWGIEGAGLATIVGMISGNILLVIQVRRLLGIDATVLGRL